MPEELLNDLVHPFSRIVVVNGDDGVWIGFVKFSGVLTAVFAEYGATTYVKHEFLRAQLTGGALAAIAVGKRFAQISIDINTLQLTLAGRDEKGAFVELFTLGKDTDLVHPHTGVAIEISGEHTLVAAAVTDRGDLALYTLLDNGGFYQLQGDRRVIASPSGDPEIRLFAKLLAELDGWGGAGGWHLNPYSDVVISFVDDELAVFVAGVNKDGPGLLRWRDSDGWQVGFVY